MASSNWKSLKDTIPRIPDRIKEQRQANAWKGKEKATSQEEPTELSNKLLAVLQKGAEGLSHARKSDPGKYLAIDCEMVGVGLNGSESVLARVSVVNFYGIVMMDRFVRPKEKVTDYRTWVSGVRPTDLENAPSFSEVVKEVAQLLNGKILVGHAIQNDLQALLLSHPRSYIRDTSTYQPLRTLAKTKHPGLKKLTKLLLNLDIQSGAHSSVDDARATMAVYRTQKDAWEAGLRSGNGSATAPCFKSGGTKPTPTTRSFSTSSKRPRAASPSVATEAPNVAGESGQETPDPLAVSPSDGIALNVSTSAPASKRHRSSLNLSATIRHLANEEDSSHAAEEGSERARKKRLAGAERARAKLEAKKKMAKAPGGKGRQVETARKGIVHKARGAAGAPSNGTRMATTMAGGNTSNWWE